MKSNVVRRTAKKFINSLRGKVDFVSVEEYLQKSGYKVIFFNTPVGDTEIIRYNLQEKANNTKAFTYKGTAKIIFIDDNVSCEDKSYLLYHETGHILLGHLDYGRLSTKNKTLIDVESDAFVYEILNPTKTDVMLPFLFIASIICSLFIGSYICAPSNSTSDTTTVSSSVVAPTYDSVYITPEGNKYHKDNCMHTKSKSCAKLYRSEAEKIFQPCKMCNP